MSGHCVSVAELRSLTRTHSGMRDAGYVYVNIDDCWEARERDKDGNLQPDPELFPSGMRALGEYIHKLGLKFGIVSEGAGVGGGVAED